VVGIVVLKQHQFQQQLLPIRHMSYLVEVVLVQHLQVGDMGVLGLYHFHQTLNRLLMVVQG
jgi:hypothetical protein